MDPDSERARLYDVFADADLDLEEKVHRALEIGADYLNLPIGFFTRIEDGTQHIVTAVGDHDRVQPGETCPLDEAYCRRTVAADGPLAVEDVDDSPIDDRAVDRFGLGAYIGAKVTTAGETYGTVCFADEGERDEPFSEGEKVFLELVAKLVGRELERQAYEDELESRTERLRREKQRFRGIAETSFDILFRIGRDARFTYVSSAVERVLGYAPEELTGERFSEFITDDSTEKAAAAYAQVLEGEDVENLELEFVDRSGEVVVLEVNATPLTDDGDVSGAQGVGRDITARKERQRELRLKNTAMDEARIGISIADLRRPDEPLVYANEGFKRLTGYDAEAFLGRNCRFLQGQATDDEAVAELRDAIDNGDATTVELINYRKNGTPFWNQVQLNPVDAADETDDVTHYLGFQRDITERKRTEQLIQLLNRVLRHNLRNDLTVLLGWTNRRVAGDPPEHDIETRIEEIVDELVELSDRARELEQYARQDRDPQRLDPGRVLSSVVEDYRTRFPSVRIDLDIDTDRGICAGPELERAVSELVENAIAHNPADAPRVTVRVRDDGEWVVLTVVDDGPGIEEIEANVISVGNETALQHSSGLGLWLVNWIATRYGGSFQIETRDDTEGTVATVRLPGIDADERVSTVARPPTVLSQ